MVNKKISSGTIHKLPDDLRRVIASDQKVLRLYGKKMVEIAKKIGCDHTTVIHNIRRFDELYEVDDMFRYNTNELLQKLHIDTKDISK